MGIYSRNGPLFSEDIWLSEEIQVSIMRTRDYRWTLISGLNCAADLQGERAIEQITLNILT